MTELKFPTDNELKRTRSPVIDAGYPGAMRTGKDLWKTTLWRWKEIYGIGYPRFLLAVGVIIAMIWYLPLNVLTLGIICVVGFWGGIALGGALVHKWVYDHVDRTDPVLMKLPNEWKGWGGKTGKM